MLCKSCKSCHWSAFCLSAVYKNGPYKCVGCGAVWKVSLPAGGVAYHSRLTHTSVGEYGASGVRRYGTLSRCRACVSSLSVDGDKIPECVQVELSGPIICGSYMMPTMYASGEALELRKI